jgi:hypothetical protein
MWENIKMKPLKLHEITTEKLIEIEEKMEEIRIGQLTRDALIKRSYERQEAIENLHTIENDVRLRVARAHNLGVDKKELASIFGVTTRELNKWIGK